MKAANYIVIGLVAMGSVLLGIVVPTVPQDKKTARSHYTVYTFHKDVLPLLQANCNPCHFPSGKMYKKLPFDDSTTVATLGKKLNTRLKQKEQQAIINGWIGREARGK